MDNRAIGVFDSGLGGLCAVGELKKILPDEKIIYFGDTGRVPYGTKSYGTIKKYAAQDVRFLLSHDVKAVLAACGTVSSVSLDGLRGEFDIPLFGVTDDAVAEALALTKNSKIAVIGTDATISSGVFERKLREGGAETFGVPCPLFVSLVECGFVGADEPLINIACEKYLKPVKESGSDTLILGCTHFPIISDAIRNFLPGVSLVNPAKEAAGRLKKELALRGLLSDGNGGTEYFVSDEPQRFGAVARIFLPDMTEAKKADIEKY